MKLRQLVYLNEVVQQSFNISAAANSLYTSQSGISRQLQELTEELGVELFTHHGRRLVGLTEVGKEIAEAAEDALRITRRIKQIAETHRLGESGALRIVASRHAMASNLHQAIVRCRQEMPGLQVEISQEDPVVALEMLKGGRADLGLLTEPTEPLGDLVYCPLAEWHLQLVVPAQHPCTELPALTLEVLAAYPCCSFERSARTRQIIDQTFELGGIKSPIAFSLDSTLSILDYVQSGLAIGFVVDDSFQPDRYPELRILDVHHLFRPLTTGLVLPRKVRITYGLRAFVSTLAPNLSLDWDNGLTISESYPRKPAAISPATGREPPRSAGRGSPPPMSPGSLRRGRTPGRV